MTWASADCWYPHSGATYSLQQGAVDAVTVFLCDEAELPTQLVAKRQHNQRLDSKVCNSDLGTSHHMWRANALGVRHPATQPSVDLIARTGDLSPFTNVSVPRRCPCTAFPNLHAARTDSIAARSSGASTPPRTAALAALTEAAEAMLVCSRLLHAPPRR